MRCCRTAELAAVEELAIPELAAELAAPGAVQRLAVEVGRGPGARRARLGAADEGRHPPLPRVCAFLSARRLVPT